MISRHHRGNRPGRVPSTKRCLVGCLVQMVTFLFAPTVQAKAVPGGCLVMPAMLFCSLCFCVLLVSDAVFCQILEQILEQIYQSHASSLHLRCKRIPADTSRGILVLSFILLFVHGPIPSADVRQVARGATPPVCTVVLAAGVGRRATDDGRRTAPGKTPATRV